MLYEEHLGVFLNIFIFTELRGLTLCFETLANEKIDNANVWLQSRLAFRQYKFYIQYSFTILN